MSHSERVDFACDKIMERTGLDKIKWKMYIQEPFDQYAYHGKDGKWHLFVFKIRKKRIVKGKWLKIFPTKKEEYYFEYYLYITKNNVFDYRNSYSLNASQNKAKELYEFLYNNTSLEIDKYIDNLIK